LTDADLLDARHEKVRPFEEAELSLVRSIVNAPTWLPETDEYRLRYGLNLARLTTIRAPDGGDIDCATFLDPYRAEVQAVIEPLLLRTGGVDKAAVQRLVPHLAARAKVWRGRLNQAFQSRLPPDGIDREVTEKALVLVAGGGGGVAYVYLGAFALLEQFNLVPRLLAGTSMGAMLLLFRARRIRFQVEEVEQVVKSLAFKNLFRFLQMESRYGLPGPMRLYLRQGLSDFLKGPDGHPLTLDQLAIPLIVTVCGVRNGALPRDPSYYEHLIDIEGIFPGPRVLRRTVSKVMNAIAELVTQRERFARIYLGAEEGTRAFDALDAVGFSCSLPGVIHYDVVRDDERMHAMLAEIFQRHDLFRLVDGGLIDNLPARAAWQVVQRGAIGTRNAFILALDGFAPKLTTPHWFGMQRIAAQGLSRNRPYIHHLKSFQKTLSPLEVVPRVSQVLRAMQNGKEELMADMPLVARMVRPFPVVLP
jgi:predicted acylesterase/phospholipase RssA